MNYKGPRERVDHRWDYTNTNDGHAYPLGYCGGLKEFEEHIYIPTWGSKEAYEEYMKPYREADKAGKFHTTGHFTSEAACLCYKQYLLDLKLDFIDNEIGPRNDHYCEYQDCNEVAPKRARVDIWNRWDLCEKHANRACVEELLDVGSSMES